jgi:hypothetical protein
MKFASIVSVTFIVESGWTKISAENFWIFSWRAEAGVASAITIAMSTVAQKRMFLRLLLNGLWNVLFLRGFRIKKHVVIPSPPRRTRNPSFFFRRLKIKRDSSLRSE